MGMRFCALPIEERIEVTKEVPIASSLVKSSKTGEDLTL